MERWDKMSDSESDECSTLCLATLLGCDISLAAERHGACPCVPSPFLMPCLRLYCVHASGQRGKCGEQGAPNMEVSALPS